MPSDIVGGVDYDQIVGEAGQATGDGLIALRGLLEQEGLIRARDDRRYVTASIAVGAESTNVRAITVQVTDGAGGDLSYRAPVLIAVFADASGNAFVGTGGSTGIEVGTDGALLPIVAKKLFLAITEADGDLDLTWTDTGTEAAFLAVITPSGRLVISTAMTNA
jgi:hypothetical protein